MGRSRGGLTSEIHAVVDTNGLPARLPAGEAHDNRLAGKLVSRLGSGTTLLAAVAMRPAVSESLPLRGALGQHTAEMRSPRTDLLQSLLLPCPQLGERFFKLAADTSRSSSLHQYGCGCALTSPRLGRLPRQELMAG
jgi:hypothetical protein